MATAGSSPIAVAFAEPVVAAHEVDHVGAQGRAAVVVEGGERLVGGAVVGLEEVDEVLRRAVAEGVGPALRSLNASTSVPSRPRRWSSSPRRRRAHAGRRRDVLADGPEQAADEPPRGPAGQRDRAPGRHTRTSSLAARSWSGANMTPTTEMTASKDASSNGSASASPSTKRTGSCSAAARSRPRWSSSGT